MTSSAVFADVSHQVEIALGNQTLSSIDTNGMDLSGQVDASENLAAIGYTYFFSPLKDDETPFELHQFYQHPSYFNAAYMATDGEGDDRTNPFVTDKYDMI